jgi:SAM-dependent methyltransferase
MSEWAGYVLEDYDFSTFAPGARVLDLGFGRGSEMRALALRGCRPIGVEIDPRRFAEVRGSGLRVLRASGTHLPFPSDTLDGVVCKVVVPLTDEARVVAEIGRVLRPGGVARVTYHGAGYYLRYLLKGPGWKRRLYGLRSLVNGWVYAASGRRLPGFLGDTVYQSRRRLRHYYERNGLEGKTTLSRRFLGFEVFIYDELTRSGVAPGSQAA